MKKKKFNKHKYIHSKFNEDFLYMSNPPKIRLPDGSFKVWTRIDQLRSDLGKLGIFPRKII